MACAPKATEVIDTVVFDSHSSAIGADTYLIPAITKAVLHWQVHYQPNDERAFLTLNGEGVLTSEKPVKSPHTFKLFVAFFADGQDDPVEQYVVDFHE